MPRLIAEVLSPFSRAIDRGPRKEVYRRAGVPELCLVEPLTQSIEVFQLAGGECRLKSTIGPNDELPLPGIEGTMMSTDRIFQTQSGRMGWAPEPEAEEALPEWMVPEKEAVGLQHIILRGHAERRREIWNNQAPCFFAFGSEEEAHHRLAGWIEEAVRWVGLRGTGENQNPARLERG